MGLGDSLDGVCDGSPEGKVLGLGLLGLFAPLLNKKNNDVHVNRTTSTSGRNDGNPLT